MLASSALKAALNALINAGVKPAKLTDDGGPLTMVKPRLGSAAVLVVTGGTTGPVVPDGACESIGADVEAGPVGPSGGNVGNTGVRPGDVGGVCIIR